MQSKKSALLTESWSIGNWRRLISRRPWDIIHETDTIWTCFTLICCKIWLKKPKINKKRQRSAHFLKKISFIIIGPSLCTSLLGNCSSIERQIAVKCKFYFHHWMEICFKNSPSLFSLWPENVTMLKFLFSWRCPSQDWNHQISQRSYQMAQSNCCCSEKRYYSHLPLCWYLPPQQVCQMSNQPITNKSS